MDGVGSQGVVYRTGAGLAGGTLQPHISTMAHTLTDTDPAAAEIMADLRERARVEAVADRGG